LTALKKCGILSIVDSPPLPTDSHVRPTLPLNLPGRLFFRLKYALLLFRLLGFSLFLASSLELRPQFQVALSCALFSLWYFSCYFLVWAVTPFSASFHADPLTLFTGGAPLFCLRLDGAMGPDKTFCAVLKSRSSLTPSSCRALGPCLLLSSPPYLYS